ncbi:helix-turn-helix domain-containing protein [Chondrinema litorale]|uniref:helix-turn-helix domain-containing protein n=1 Tax=Chondrinema litorale TaxID=2994555 RepID=UPI0025438753|nr:helix-turn-helix transcriptional regulator [Chondrinema litorale]UZS00287.1 helix-turn-helix transcriptional regulator [Chondrinema litorale]
MMDFLERLRIIRKKLGTQKEVATNAGLEQSMISRYEKGQTTVYDYRFLMYLAKQGIDINWLLTGEGKQESDLSEVSEQGYEMMIDALKLKVDALELKVNAQKELIEVRDQEIAILKDKKKQTS